VFLKIKAKRSLLKLGNCPKLVSRYFGPFEVLERKGPVAYMLSFSAFMGVHNMFHVSLLNKYVTNPNHMIDWNVIQVDYKGEFHVKSVHIMDRKFKVTRNQAIDLVKVQWTCYSF
jgi:hypothetical protein